jgi:arylamine N-acetyltransferase
VDTVKQARVDDRDQYLVSADGDVPAMTEHLDAYLKRIGVARPEQADLDALQAIIKGHTRSIAFENLDPLTGRGVSTNDADLVAKLVHGGRGGFCFEHDLLLRGMLEAVGFRTAALSARVVWGRKPGAPAAPRTHMLLRVELAEGSYLADVGFGGQTMTGAITLTPSSEQATPHEPFRLTPGDDGTYLLESLVAESWQPLYTFELAPQPRADLAMGSWFVATHPASLFRTALTVARADPDRRYNLWNTRLTTHHLHGATEHRELTTPAEILGVLEKTFQLDLTGLDDLEATLGRVLF